MKALAIIPARGGSKRIPHKNVQAFHGEPAISYPIRAAIQSGVFASVQVSTDSQAVRDVALRLGCAPGLDRPAELADDHSTILDVMAWVDSQLDHSYDAVCLIYATAVFLSPDYLRGSHDMFRSQRGSLPVISAARFPVPAQWALVQGPSGALIPREPEMITVRSQDLPATFYEAAMFVWFPRSRLQSPVSIFPCVPFPIQAEDAIDIDTPEDWQRAEREAAARWPSQFATISPLSLSSTPA